MSLAQLQRPMAAAASGLSTRLLATSFVPRGAPWRAAGANVLVEGRRGAAVKSQGAYKTKPKRTIPKKLGAKKTGGTWTRATPRHASLRVDPSNTSRCISPDT
ncbi:hypothetical protein IMZ48_24610 [Candidatus Bathyarchaeota archaeon]|nr:hypothetical protein [Candidatus Bathyarchaeota archaeon]